MLKFSGGKDARAEVKRREKEGAIEPEVVIPKPAPGLTAAGRKRWNEVATILAGMRVMTSADVDALQFYVESWLRWRKATNKVRKDGEVILSPKKYPIQNPWLAIANKAQDQCNKYLIEFGLTPSARARVNREQ